MSIAASPSLTAPVTFAYNVLAKLLADFPADKLTFQPAKTDNHVLWSLGHLAVTDHWFLSLLKSVSPSVALPRPLPENWNTLFGYKSTPTGAPASYPPFNEVRAAADAAHKALVLALDSLSDPQRSHPFGEAGFGFVSDSNDLVVKSAWHLGWHAGQVSAIRRALGLPPSM